MKHDIHAHKHTVNYMEYFFKSKYSKGGSCYEILLKKAKHTLQLGSGSTPSIGIWLTGLKPRKQRKIGLSIYLYI
jgi:hypothetical protein